MKIGINALYWRPNKMGGTQTYFRNLISNLLKTDPKNKYVLFVNRLGASALNGEAVRCRVVSAPRFVTAPLIRLLWENLVLAETLKRENVDVLHSLGYLCPVRCGCRQIITVHDTVHYQWPQTIANSKLRIWKYLFPRALKRAADIITISQSVEHELYELFPFTRGKVTTVHLGVDTSAFSPSVTRPSTEVKIVRGGRYVVSVCSAAKHKNQQMLIEAFRHICAAGGERKLVLVGMMTPEAMRLQELVLMWKMNNRVIFTGWITDAEVAALYAGADAFVTTSLYEGFGLPILEAMACGCPVIATDIPVFREIAGDAALLFKRDSVESLVHCIKKVTEDREVSRALKERGMACAKRYDWEKTAMETIAVYEFGRHGDKGKSRMSGDGNG